MPKGETKMLNKYGQKEDFLPRQPEEFKKNLAPAGEDRKIETYPRQKPNRGVKHPDRFVRG